MITCPICKKKFSFISFSHLKSKHGMTLAKFKKLYPKAPLTSKEKREKTSKTCKKSGCGQWFEGIKLTQVHKDKISKVTKGKNNPFYGKNHSKKTRLRMKRNHADFTINKNPYANALKNHPEKRVEAKKRAKNNWIKRRKDKKTFKKYCEDVSKRVVKDILTGKQQVYGKNHAHGYYSFKNGKKLYYRSSYELKFLKWCEKNKFPVKVCNFSIPYVDKQGQEKQYIPDFIIKNTIIEIKPSGLNNYKDNPAKKKTLIRFCRSNSYNYLWLNEKELGINRKSDEMTPKASLAKFLKHPPSRTIL